MNINKIITLIIFLASLSLSLSSQTIERQIIGAGGTTFNNVDYAVDFTIGELIITSISDSNVEISQGFHQNVVVEIKVNPIAFLQGAILNPNSGEESLMRDDLRVQNFIPTTSPYSDSATCNASVFVQTGQNAIVDWVWVELRDSSDNTNVLYGKSALLQRDGNVVDVDGTSNLTFMGASPDDYFVVVDHRNHLGIMTSSTISLSSTVVSVDFTEAATPITYGTNAQTTYSMPSGKLGMWAGDIDKNGNINFLLDRNVVLFDVFLFPSNVTFNSSYTLANTYSNSDVNLNGNISFLNDSNSILFNIFFFPDNITFSSSYNALDEQLPSSTTSKSLKHKALLKQRSYISETIKRIQETINN